MKFLIIFSSISIILLSHLVISAEEEINIKINRVYSNKYGEPQALVTVTNNLNEGLHFVEVKCTWLNGDSPVAVDKRIYQNLPKGENDSQRFWATEEGLTFDSARCRISDIETTNAHEKALDRYEKSFGWRPK